LKGSKLINDLTPENRDDNPKLDEHSDIYVLQL